MTDLKSSDTRCVLCLDQKRSPVRIQCGHSFCRDCLEVYKTYQKYDWANKCPICRGRLKEKKRAVKRKYSSTNMAEENPAQNPITSVTENQADPVEQVFILEEFMAWASGYASNDTQNVNNDQYDDDDDEYDVFDNNEEVSDREVNALTDEEEQSVGGGDDVDDDFDDYNDDYFDDDYYELGNDNAVDFSTDSEYEDINYYQFDDDFSNTDNYYQEEIEVHNITETQSSPLQQQQQQQQYQQQQQEYVFTDNNNNTSNSSSFEDNLIDWDEAIANEIIIID